jgi:hypothetical protein
MHAENRRGFEDPKSSPRSIVARAEEQRVARVRTGGPHVGPPVKRRSARSDQPVFAMTARISFASNARSVVVRMLPAPAETSSPAASASVSGLACIAARNADATSAGHLWTLAERIEQQVGFRMLAAERRRYENILTGPLRASDGYHAGTMQAAAEPDPLSGPYRVSTSVSNRRVSLALRTSNDRKGRATGLASAGASVSASPGASERDLTVTSRAWKSSKAECERGLRLARIALASTRGRCGLCVLLERPDGACDRAGHRLLP